ncbi:MAG: sulfurtransferase TusA family protein [Chloroflexota bacterium]|nr:sulfurtransferase TusA family protein [Chloroflexota bacterium]
MKIDKVIDTKGLLCPMPVVKTKLALEDVEPGQVVQVLATDPAAPKDFVAWCHETGNKLLKSGQEGKVFVLTIQKGREPS